ncbi:hypothetical protein RB595_000451 [Gaeumannomyces hyphopodioides]
MSSALKAALSKAASPGRLIPRPSAYLPAWTVAASGRSVSGVRRNAADEQAQPLGLYYELLLDDPPPYGSVKPKADSPPAPTSAAPPPGPEKARRSGALPEPNPDPEASSPPSPPKPGIVFGSSLAGPAARAERLAAVRSRSVVVAGVLVPPKPEEPDNCCMSGCVNCVWDRYREEMEEWATASAEADGRLLAQKKQKQQGAGADGPAGKTMAEEGTPLAAAAPKPRQHAAVAVSMDDDGGGSDTNWAPAKKSPKIAKDLWDDGLYNNVPVGIREFMKQEKRLKEKHRLEGTSSG